MKRNALVGLTVLVGSSMGHASQLLSGLVSYSTDPAQAFPIGQAAVSVHHGQLDLSAIVQDDSSILPVFSAFEIELPDVGSQSLIIEGITESQGSVSYHGFFGDNDLGEFVLSFDHAGHLVGKIYTPERRYVVVTDDSPFADELGLANAAKSAVAAVVTVDPTLIPPYEESSASDDPLEEPYNAVFDLLLGSPLPSGSGSNPPPLRIGFYFESRYSSSFRNNLSNNIITELNRSFQNSRIPTRFFAQRAEHRGLSGNWADVVSRNDMRRAMSELTFRPNLQTNYFNLGISDNINLWRKNSGADIGLHIAKAGSSFERSGGAARSYEPVDPWAVSMDTWALGDFTALHEIGHVLGGLHTSETAQTHRVYAATEDAMVPTLARGYTLPHYPTQSMMGGYLEPNCPADPTVPPPNQQCLRQPTWSSPSNYLQGKPGGPAGDATHNMVTWLTSPGNGLERAAGWNERYDPHQDRVAAGKVGPPAQSTRKVIDDTEVASCNGIASVTWTEQPNADLYRVYLHAGDWDYAPTVYEGDGVELRLMVAESEFPFRVDSCDAAGCSRLIEGRIVSNPC